MSPYIHFHRLGICALILVMLLTVNAVAQTASPTPKPAASPTASVSPPSLEGLENNLPDDPSDEPVNSSSKGMKPPISPSQADDEATKQAYRAAKQAYYQYSKSSLEHRSKVFGWQLLSSRLIFITVILLVFAGVFFSGVQFYSSMQEQKLRRAINAANRKLRNAQSKGKRGQDSAEPLDIPPPLVNEATQIEASLQGIKVNSPILGVIILAISFLFFFLYLKYVYPINELF